MKQNKKDAQILYKCTSEQKSAIQCMQQLQGFDTMTDYLTMLIIADVLKAKKDLKKQKRLDELKRVEAETDCLTRGLDRFL